MIRTLAVCFFCLLVATLPSGVQASADSVIWRASIPAEPPHQGEVRLIRRDSALVMQTILNSKVLKHVIAAIQKKELRAWPEDREGWVDSRRYSDELYRAYEAVRTDAKDREDKDDRHLRLMIEFVLEERHSFVSFYAPTLTKRGERYSVQEKKLLKKLNTSRAYLYNNLGEIARDSFQIDEKEALKLMQPIPGGF